MSEETILILGLLFGYLIAVCAIWLSVEIEYLRNGALEMIASSEDIDRGYKKCIDCDKVFIFNAGADYPQDAWVKCDVCHSWVVDLNKDNEPE